MVLASKEERKEDRNIDLLLYRLLKIKPTLRQYRASYLRLLLKNLKIKGIRFYKINLTYKHLNYWMKKLCELMFFNNLIFRCENVSSLRKWIEFQGYNPRAKSCIKRMCCSKLPIYMLALQEIPKDNPLYEYLTPLYYENVLTLLSCGFAHSYTFHTLNNGFYVVFDAKKLVENMISVYPVYYVLNIENHENSMKYVKFNFYHVSDPLTWLELEFFTIDYVPLSFVEKVYTTNAVIAEKFENLGVKVEDIRNLAEWMEATIGEEGIVMLLVLATLFNYYKILQNYGIKLTSKHIDKLLAIYNEYANKWLVTIGVKPSNNHYRV